MEEILSDEFKRPKGFPDAKWEFVEGHNKEVVNWIIPCGVCQEETHHWGDKITSPWVLDTPPICSRECSAISGYQPN